MSSISSFGRRSSIDDRHSSISSAGNMDTINEQSIVDQFQPRPIVTELDDHGICGIAPLHNKRQRRGSFVGFSDDHDQRNRCDIPDLGPNKRKDLASAPSVGGFNLATAITERKELPRGLNPFDFKRFQNKDHGLTYQYSSSESDLTTTDQLKHNNMSILLEKTEYKNDSERRPKSGDRSIERRESASGLSGNENPYMIVRCTFGSAGQAVLIDVDTTKAKQKQHKESQRRKRKECFWKMITLLFFLGTCAIFPYAVVQHVKYINKSKLSEKDVINGGNTIQSRSNKPAVTTLVSMNISREQVTLPPKTTILLTTRSAESTSPGNSTKAPLLSKNPKP